MTNEILVSMSKKDVLFGAQHAYYNAKSLYTGGLQLGANGNYGTANALLILSTEECVKCMILAAGFINVKIDFKIEPFFKDHKTKHKKAGEMQKFINSFSLFKTALTDVFEKRKSAFSIVVNLGIAAVLSSVDFGKGDSTRFAKWWAEEANEMKNNGLYVGYFNGKWSLPTDVTKATFDDTIQLTKPFIEALEPIRKFKDDDYKLFLKANDPERGNYLPSTTPELIPAENPGTDFDPSQYTEVSR